jgi:hypothetical protein
MFFVEFSIRSNAMSQTTSYYTHAELSLAAFANLAPGVDPVPALTDCAIDTQLDVLTKPSFNPHSIVLLTDTSKVSPGSTRGDDAWSLVA